MGNHRSIVTWLLLVPLLACAHATPKPAFVTALADAPLSDQLAGTTLLDALESGPDTLLLVAGPAGDPLKDALRGEAGRVGLGVLRVRDGRVVARAFLGEFLLPLEHRGAALDLVDEAAPARPRDRRRRSRRPALDDDETDTTPDTALPEPAAPVRVLVSSLLDPGGELAAVSLHFLERATLAPLGQRTVYTKGPMAWFPRFTGDELHLTIALSREPRECRVLLEEFEGPPPAEECRRSDFDRALDAWNRSRRRRTHDLFPDDPRGLQRRMVADTTQDPCGFGLKQALAKDDPLAAAELLTRPGCEGHATAERLDAVVSALTARLDGCRPEEAFTQAFRDAAAEWGRTRTGRGTRPFTRLAQTHASGDPASCGRRILTLVAAGRFTDADRLLGEGRGGTLSLFELEAAADAPLQRGPSKELSAFARKQGLTGIVAELDRRPSAEVASLRSRARRLRPTHPHAAALAQLLAKRLGDTLPSPRRDDEPDTWSAGPPEPEGNTVVASVAAPADCGLELRQWVEGHPRPAGAFRGFEVLSLACGSVAGPDHVERTERKVEREVVGQMPCNQPGAATLDPLSGCQGLQKKTFVEEGVRVVQGRAYATITGTVRFVHGDRATRTTEFSTSPTSLASGYFATDVARDLKRKVDWDRKTADALFGADLRRASSDEDREETCASHALRGNHPPSLRGTLSGLYGQSTGWRAWPWNSAE